MENTAVRSPAQAGGGVKWFQCDSDAPDDPKLKAIIRRGLEPAVPQQAAAGALWLLWCFIAYHGEGEPGVGVKRDGLPLNLREMATECHFRAVDDLTRFLGECAEDGHIQKDAWLQNGIVVLPAMRKRADTYTKRIGKVFEQPGQLFEEQGLNFEHCSKSRVLSCTVPSGSEVIDRSKGTDTGGSGLLPLAGADQVDALIDVWNEEAHTSLPRVRKPNPARRATFARALKAHPDLKKWRAVIRHLNASNWWLHGGKDHPNWRGDLDFLCRGSGSIFERQLARYEADQRTAGGPQRGQQVDAKRGRVIPIPGKYGNLQRS